MDLLALPVELRFKIYSELLVHCAPIDISNAQDFSTRVFGGAPPILYGEGIELWPALLRTSKRVYGEAISLLYSDNFFRFPDLVVTPGGYSTNVAGFIGQIGAQASLLRNICIRFPPTLPGRSHVEDVGREDIYLEDLDLLHDVCPGIKTLGLSLPSARANSVLGYSLRFTKSLDLIHTRLDALQSLREFRVDLRLFGRHPDEESSPEAEGSDDDDSLDEERESHRESWRESLRQLRSRGWIVNITKVSSVEESRISPDEELGSDDEGDIIAWFWRDMQRQRDQLEVYLRDQLLGQDALEEYTRDDQAEVTRLGDADGEGLT